MRVATFHPPEPLTNLHMAQQLDMSVHWCPVTLYFLSVSSVAPLSVCEGTHALSHRHSFCVKGCSGKQRAEWLSVSGALVMCWWYSLSGMCTRVLPSLAL